MTRRTVGLVATPIFTLIVAAGGYVAGSTRSAQASEVMQTRPPKICWHDQTSVYRCGSTDTTSSFFAPVPLMPASVQEISVTLRPRVGRSITFHVPGTTDAIFFGRAPIEGMLARYYEAEARSGPRTLRRIMAARLDSLRIELRGWSR